MRPMIRITAVMSVALALAACDQTGSAEVERALDGVNVIDETNLSQIMLTSADPDEAVAYFRRSSAENPDRIDLRRGLASSLVRAGQYTQGVATWREVVASDEATDEDRVEYAGALIRTNDWDAAEAQLGRDEGLQGRVDPPLGKPLGDPADAL